MMKRREYSPRSQNIFLKSGMILLKHQHSATKNVKFIYSTAISLTGIYHIDNLAKVHKPRLVINVVGSRGFK